MESLKRKRTQLRREFTLLADDLERFDETQTYEDFEESYMLVSETSEALFRVEDAIRELWCSVEPFDEKAFQEDQDKAMTYRKRWFRLQTKHKRISSKMSYCKSEQSLCSAESMVADRCDDRSSKNQRRLHMPKLELMKFDGNLKNWLLWWGQFQKIHDDGELDNIDKFQYLLQSMTPESNARQLVESYPPSGDNYVKALDALKARFAREDILIETYVRGILNLVLLQNKGEHHSIGLLYDNLHSHLQALETLGVANDKYASILYPMIESALPEEILRTWNRIRYRSEIKGDDLTKLMQFLKDEVESEERIQLARTGFEASSKPPTACFVAEGKIERSTDKMKQGEITKNVCIWCEKISHASTECYKAAKMTLADRRELLKSKKACLICLKVGHTAKKCRSFPKCLICKKRHVTLLCSDLQNEKAVLKEDNDSEQKSGQMLCQLKTTTVLQTLAVKVVNGTKQANVRVLIDSGAQRSYVTKELVQRLQLEPISKESISHCLFGGYETKREDYNVYNISVHSDFCNFVLNMSVLEQENICGLLPKIKTDFIVRKLLDKHVTLTETADTPDFISLLIGADYSGALLTGDLIQIDDTLTAIRTKLGWTVQGQTAGTFSTQVKSTTLHSICKIDLKDLWSLEILGINDPFQQVSRQARDMEILQQFNSSLRINEENRYEVRLPWKENMPRPMSNYDAARKRLLSTSARLKALGKSAEYNSIFEEWQSLDFIEISPGQDMVSGFFLPHHPVIKESSLTTKIRPVFDASAKDINGVSLNSCLEKGTNLIELIPGLLIGFRKYAIGITADVAKAFLQISVASEDRNFLKFLWWSNYNDQSQGITVYRHRRVVFGVTSSPFHLAATILYNLDNCPDHLKNTADKLKRSFYVDNCVISLNTKEEMLKFIKEAKEVMNLGMFDLRCWVTAPERVDQQTTTISVLGMMWDTINDELFGNVSAITTVDVKLTKRSLLSLTLKVFDPLGFYAPITIIPKMILQKSWSLNIGWDAELPADLAKEFQRWAKYLHLIPNIKIPRRLTTFNIELANNTLHVFCDASLHAYAACAFLRSQYNNEVNINLVMAKSRVAPVKPPTIPRLELIAATLAVRLAQTVIESLKLTCNVYYWTDSTVALSWIKGEGEWNVFVANRVKEIKKYSSPDSWFHIPGNLNPADLPSRGTDVKTLLESDWLKGPSWLMLGSEEWPSISCDIDKLAFDERKKGSVNVNMCANGDVLLSRISFYFSSYIRVVRMIAWILRIKYKSNRNYSELLYEEVERAEICLIKLMQCSYQSRVGALKVFKDNDGILRLETKLQLSSEPFEFKSPILLFSDGILVKRLVEERHKTLQHAGASTMTLSLRERYWIVGVRRLVKTVIRDCAVCKRFKGKSYVTPPASLPTGRVEGNVPFEVSGVDLTGPLLLKSGNKCWLVLFTCATYRAIHLDVVESLSTSDFILALRRFIARRGRVKTIYSDNGTNFRGLDNMLNLLEWNSILCFSSVVKINWIFIPPGSPWWGGFYERLIGLVKQILRRMLGKASLSLVELQTILCDCEAVINSRPLTYVTTDPNEFKPLTPACFIQPLAESSVPELDEIDRKSLNLRMRYCQKLRDDFRQRFRYEYLGSLIHRVKNISGSIQPRVGDVVLLETEEKRIKWPLCKIEELYEGADGVSRVAKIRTASGSKVRAVQRLYPLEVSEPENIHSLTDPSADKGQTTRSGRTVRRPARLND